MNEFDKLKQEVDSAIKAYLECVECANEANKQVAILEVICKVLKRYKSGN